jgi:hypothetical protein
MKRFHRFYALLALLLVASLMAPAAFGQSLVSGDLTGTVTDPTGAVLANATVTLKSNATGEIRTSPTNSSGSYRFSLLGPGSYTVSVAAQGFSKTESQFSVNVGQSTIANIKMAVGASTQTVEVTGAPSLVQTDNANLTTNFNGNIIQNQPNGGNDLTYIAQTAPGVTMNTGQGYGNFSAYGLPATSNLFTVNGENDMDPYLNLNNSGATNLTLGRNEVQEATVISNAYSGQYGQQAGAQVNYVTKSGTNQYHGNVFYEWTGRAMDANDWFNNRSGTARPFANNNEWGANFGGPIKKDKWFFFVDYEAVQYIVPSSEPVYVPSPTYISQTLANLQATAPAEVARYQQLFNIYTNAKGYNGTNYTAGSCGSLLPTLNPAFTADNCFSSYQATPALPGTEWILPFRIDWNQSQNNQFYFRARIDHGTQATLADPFNNNLSAASKQPAYDGQFGWTHVFSSNMTNQFSADLSHYQAIFSQVNPSVLPFGIVSTGFNLGDPSGVTSYSWDFPQGRNVTQYQFIEDLSWTKGKHNLKFGANFRRYDISDFTFSVRNNPEILIGDATQFDANGNPLDGGQTDFYNGIALQTRQSFPSASEQPVALWGIGLYAQDEWKVTQNLTLTLALRAEKNSNPVCQTDCGSLTRGGASFTNLLAAGLLTPTTPYNTIINGHRHQLYNATDTIDWAPRFGFAWSPLGPNTVFRGGFGIFDDAFPAVVGDSFMTNLPGLVNVRISATPWGDTTTPASPYIQGANSAAAIMSGFNNGASYASLRAQLGSQFRVPGYNSQVGTFHTPYYEQWSFGVQQAMGKATTLSISYVGNHGVHIPVNNEGLNAYGAGFAPFPDTKPTPIFGVYQQYQSAGISNYNGITSSVAMRATHGLSLNFSYTWSHANDDVSNGGISATPYNNSQSFGSLVYQINPACLSCNNYGPADYDVRNSFNGTYVYQTPWKFSNGFANAALGGWLISENFFWRSGLPLTVIDGTTSITNYGPVNTVANVLSGLGQQGCVNGNSQCLNPNAFGPSNLFSTFPNQRRNGYRGPHFFDSDVTIGKNFKLTERFLFNFTTNFYNIFNHPNFANPDLNLADSTFGQPQVTTAPPTGPYGSFFTGLPSGRIIQFAGKIVF